MLYNMSFKKKELKNIESFLKGNKKQKYYFCKCSDGELKTIVKVLKHFKSKYKKLDPQIRRKLFPLLQLVKQFSRKTVNLKKIRKLCTNITFRKQLNSLLNETLLPKILLKL